MISTFLISIATKSPPYPLDHTGSQLSLMKDIHILYLLLSY